MSKQKSVEEKLDDIIVDYGAIGQIFAGSEENTRDFPYLKAKLIALIESEKDKHAKQLQDRLNRMTESRNEWRKLANKASESI